MLSMTPYPRGGRRSRHSILGRALAVLAVLLTVLILVTVSLYFQLRDIFAPPSAALTEPRTTAAETVSPFRGTVRLTPQEQEAGK